MANCTVCIRHAIIVMSCPTPLYSQVIVVLLNALLEYFGFLP